MSRYTLADDPNGCPTIWDERHEPVATLDNVILLGAKYRDLPWSVLTSVLAPDEATVERLAELMYGALLPASAGPLCAYRQNVRFVLAALAAAPDPDGGKDEGVSG